TDGGNIFEESLILSDTVGDCKDGDNTLEGATPAVGPDGTVYVAWSGHGHIYFDKSTDGGKTFGKDAIIAGQAGSWEMPIDHIMRANGMPFLVCDNSGGKYNGNLYLLFGDETHGDADIMIMKSPDGGKTWTGKKRIHKDAEGNGKDQFFGHLAIDQTTGDIFVIYYDRRNSENNLFVDVYVAYSTDGGETFTERRVTNEPFAAPGATVFFGDYNGIAAHKGIVRPIWTDITNGQLAVKTALLNKNMLEKDSFGRAVNYLGVKANRDDKDIVFHVRVKELKPYVIKITEKTTGKTFWNYLMTKNLVHEFELKPADIVLPAGKYKIEFKSPSVTMTEEFEVMN
ncbi:MAG TPA: sialidase family protein, partial [Bacillota bacterium]|nr:sialidase family protein [Bacillota bacterium]